MTAVVAPAAWAAGRRDVVHLGDAVLDAGVQVGARGLVTAPGGAEPQVRGPEPYSAGVDRERVTTLA